MKRDVTTSSCSTPIRSLSRRFKRYSFLSCAATVAATGLALGLAIPAHAGHWVVTLNGSTSGPNNSHTFVNNVPTAPQSMYGPPIVQFNSMPQGEQVTDSFIQPNNAPILPSSSGVLNSMVVQATFTWTPDNANDTSSPPTSVTVLESSWASTNGLDAGSGNELMQASDGLASSLMLDPAVFDNVASGVPFRASTAISAGSYTKSVTLNTGAKTFTLPQRMLSVAVEGGPPPQASGSGRQVYSASVDISPDVVITVSPVSAALGGTATSVITVASINGFAGTVILGLVGQGPTGALPALPSGGSFPGGYTIVGMPAGATYTGGPNQVTQTMSGPYGPTVAQLAARVQGTFSVPSVTLTSGGTATATATLTLTSNSLGAAGTYPIEIEGDAYPTGSSTATVRDGLTTLTLQ